MLYRIIFFWISCITFLMTGANIKGVVNDSLTGESLISAVVFIKGTEQSVESDLEGRFEFKNAPSGSLVLVCFAEGYLRRELIVTIDSAESEATVQFLLVNEAITDLATVTMISAHDRESDENARAKEKNADQITNIVSAKAIQISPDITVANVVQRVSGISVERSSNGDGQHAIVRGMDKRYNYTTVNGVKIPSPDNKYRYVPLDLFPAEMLDRLEVTKSLSPQLEGDAIGGAINLVMKDAPDHPYLSANIATGFCELFTKRDFVSYGFKAIHEVSPYEERGKNYSAQLSDFPTGTIAYKNISAPLNTVAGLSLGNRFFKKKLGVLIATSYQNTYRGSNSTFFGAENVDTNRYATLVNMSERQYSELQRRYGVHAKLDYKLGARHKFHWYNVAIGLDNIQIRNVKTVDFSSNYHPDSGTAKLTYSTRSRYTTQKIYNSTLQGEHSLLPKFKIQWSAVYSLATNLVPDNTTINLRGVRENNQDRITTANNATRRWEHNSDRDFSAYLNLTYTQRLIDTDLEWMMGGLYRTKHRDNFYNNYTFQIHPDHVNDEFGKDFQRYSDIPWLLQNPKGSVATALNYDATEELRDGYLQFKFTKFKTQVLGGARVEHIQQGYVLRYPANESYPVGKQTYTDLLPSLSLKYMPYKNHNVRLSYFRSLNRPGFFEIVPYNMIYEDYRERGNPQLKRALADNLDMRYEYFPKANEQYMLGIFYKHIQNPIEYTLQADAKRGSDIYYSPGNFGNATNYGLELDLIKYYKKLGLKANYTYTHSAITTAKSLRIRDEKGDLKLISVDQTRPLYGQAAHVGNVTFMFIDSKKGLETQIAAAYTGARINTVSQFVDNDLWQKGILQMDLSLNKTFKKKLTVFLKVNNLLNTPLEVYIKGENMANKEIPLQEKSGKTLIQKDYYQRSYLLGLRYKF